MIAGEFDLSVVGTYALGGMVAVQAGQSSPGARRAGGGRVRRRDRGRPGRTDRRAADPVDAGHARDVHRAARPDLRDVRRPERLLHQLRRDPVGRPDRRRRLLAAQPDHPRRRSCSRRWCWASPGSVPSCERSAATAGPAGSPASAWTGPWSCSSPPPARSPPSAARCSAYSFASANPDPGLRPLLIAAVAALLGGRLAGRRPRVRRSGCSPGRSSVALLAQIVAVAYLPDYSIQLFYAALLAVIVAVDSPGSARERARARSVAPGAAVAAVMAQPDLRLHRAHRAGHRRRPRRRPRDRRALPGLPGPRSTSSTSRTDVVAATAARDRRGRAGRRRHRQRPGRRRRGPGRRRHRPARRTGQQRRHPARRRGVEAQRRRLRGGDGGARRRHLPVHPGRRAALPPAGLRAGSST